MFFEYLCQTKCKRYRLGKLEKVEFNFSAKTQQILGSNGAGKSSLFHAGLSVVPPDKADYWPGGSKIIRLIHGGRRYELKFFYNSKIEHHFICDGEPLNQGLTGAVQKELVKEHFGITSDIHDVLCGVELFTDMSLTKRREWLTRLSSSDFGYILNLYDKTSKKSRATTTILKHNTDRLTVETAKLMSSEDLEHLTRRAKQLTGELNVLLRESNAQRAQGIQQIHDRLVEDKKALHQTVFELAGENLHPPEGTHYGSLQGVKDTLAHLQGRSAELQGQLSTLGEDFQYYEGQMAKLQSIEGLDAETLQTKLNAFDAQIAELQSTLVTGLEYEELTSSPKVTETVGELIDLLHVLTLEDEAKYRNDLVEIARREMDELQSRLAATGKTLGNIEGRLEHIDACVETKCPQCNHGFKPGVAADERQKMLDNLLKGATLRKGLESKVKERREFLGEAEDYFNKLRAVQRFRTIHSELAGLWSWIDRKGGLEVGRTLTGVCHQYLNDARQVAKIRSVREQRKPVQETLDMLEKVSGESNTIVERYTKLKAQIEAVTNEVYDCRREMMGTHRYLEKNLMFERRVDALQERYEQYGLDVDQYLEAIRQSEISSVIKSHQSSLAIADNALVESEVQQGIVKDIQNQIEKLRLQEAAYRVLVSVMSPTDGLIAELIVVFINAMIEQMNHSIATVWGYPMGLGACDVAESDLDYNFPLWVNDPTDPVSDIKKGSAGQKQIINQAFRLLVYKAGRFNGFPLYLDEPEKSLDPAHRLNIIPVIKGFIEDPMFSQVFLISHFIAEQGSFPGAQTAVLDSTNIDVSQTHNEHVSLG